MELTTLPPNSYSNKTASSISFLEDPPPPPYHLHEPIYLLRPHLSLTIQSQKLKRLTYNLHHYQNKKKLATKLKSNRKKYTPNSYPNKYQYKVVAIIH